MNEAIKLAIEKGGYRIRGYTDPRYEYISADKGELVYRYEGEVSSVKFWPAMFNEYVLDPLFWQALGKALGWDNGGYYHHYPDNFSRFWQTEWLYHALHYHELNLTGGSTEKFWNEVLDLK